MEHARVVIVLATCLPILCAMKCTILNDICGEISPVDPNAAIGMNLSLTCSLNRSFMDHYNVNSSNIYFKITPVVGNKSGYTEKHPQIEDSTMAQMYIPNVTLEFGNYFVNCFVKLKETNHSDKKIKVTVQIMYVGYMPYQPTVTDFYIANWEKLVIEWKTARNNPHFKTAYTAWYQSSDEEWHKCESQKKERCEVEVNDSNFNIYAQQVHVKVNGTNILGDTSSETGIREITSLIIPNVIQNNRTNVKARTVQIAWDSPKPTNVGLQGYMDGIMVNYEIMYVETDMLNTTTGNISIASMKGIEYMLSSLRPYTKYSITVRCKAEKSARWSRNSTFNVTTREDKPEAAPLVTPASFFVKVNQNNSRDIYLFWKDIPNEKGNGKIIEYKLTKIAGRKSIVKIPVNKPTFSYKIQNLALDKSYHFYVNAKNSKGYNESLNLESIHLPKKDSILYMPEFKFVANIDKSRVNVTWKLEKPGEVTIYWCNGNLLQSPRCLDEIQWKIIKDGEVGNAVIKWDITDGQMFGSSLRRGSFSSGIHWTQCLFYENDAPDVPRPEVLFNTENSISLRLRRPECSKSRANIDSFEVIYCKKQQNVMKCDGGETVKKFKVELSDLYKLDKLEASVTYLLKFRSKSGNLLSYNSSFIETTTLSKDHTVPVFIGFGCLVLIIVIGIVCWVFFWLIKRRKKPLQIKQPPDASSEAKEMTPISTNKVLVDAENIQPEQLNTNYIKVEDGPKKMIQVPDPPLQWKGRSRRGSSNDSVETEEPRTDIQYCVHPMQNGNPHNNQCSQEEIDNYQNRLLSGSSFFSRGSGSSRSKNDPAVKLTHIPVDDAHTPLIINPASFPNGTPVECLGVTQHRDNDDNGGEKFAFPTDSSENFEDLQSDSGYAQVLKTGEDKSSFNHAKVSPYKDDVVGKYSVRSPLLNENQRDNSVAIPPVVMNEHFSEDATVEISDVTLNESEPSNDKVKLSVDLPPNNRSESKQSPPNRGFSIPPIIQERPSTDDMIVGMVIPPITGNHTDSNVPYNNHQRHEPAIGRTTGLALLLANEGQGEHGQNSNVKHNENINNDSRHSAEESTNDNELEDTYVDDVYSNSNVINDDRNRNNNETHNVVNDPSNPPSSQTKPMVTSIPPVDSTPVTPPELPEIPESIINTFVEGNSNSQELNENASTNTGITEYSVAAWNTSSGSSDDYANVNARSQYDEPLLKNSS